jgi:hypothetical protein
MFTTSNAFIRTLAVGFFVTLLSACGGAPPTNAELESEAFDDLRSEVRDVIVDDEREAAVVAIVDQLHDEFTSMRKLAEERRSEIRALNSDYDATREQFIELVDKYAAQREVSQARFQEVRAALEASVTAEEWEQLERTNTKAMASLARLISGI